MDVALVNLKKSDTFLTVIPSKIFESSAMGKPIILGLQGETKGIIESFDAGVCYEPENEIEFIEATKCIFEKETYLEKQQGALKLAKSFDRKKLPMTCITV